MRWPLMDRIVLGVVIAGIVVFVALACAIGSPLIQSIDESLIRALRTDDEALGPRWPAWFQEVARDYTALGGYAVLMTLTFLVWAFLRLEGRRQRARFAMLVVICGYLMSMVLKGLISRPRPDIVPHLAHVDHIGKQSFPSGHSTMSTVVYLTLALMLSELSARQSFLDRRADDGGHRGGHQQSHDGSALSDRRHCRLGLRTKLVARSVAGPQTLASSRALSHIRCWRSCVSDQSRHHRSA